MKLPIIHFLIYIPFLEDPCDLCWVSRLFCSRVCQYNPRFLLKNETFQIVSCLTICCSCCYLGLIISHLCNYFLFLSFFLSCVLQTYLSLFASVSYIFPIILPVNHSVISACLLKFLTLSRRWRKATQVDCLSFLQRLNHCIKPLHPKNTKNPNSCQT